MRPRLVELLSLDVETSKKYPPAQPASSRLQGVQLTPPQVDRASPIKGFVLQESHNGVSLLQDLHKS